MQNYSMISIEIISVTVQAGYADSYIAFESTLTRLLNQRYPMYHRGADIYQSTVDPNTFFILTQYNQGICGTQALADDLENFVQAQYAACFPYIVSRTIITNQDQNLLVDRSFNKIC